MTDELFFIWGYFTLLVAQEIKIKKIKKTLPTRYHHFTQAYQKT